MLGRAEFESSRSPIENVEETREAGERQTTCRDVDAMNCAADYVEGCNIWFVDHIYHETMFRMFKKVI